MQYEMPDRFEFFGKIVRPMREKKKKKSNTKFESMQAERETAAAEAKGELADTTKDRDYDQEYLDLMNAQCTQKSRGAERLRLRP